MAWAWCITNVGVASPGAEVRDILEVAIRIWQELADRFPDQLRYREFLSLGYHNLAHSLDWNQALEAIPFQERAVELREQLAIAQPESKKAHVQWAQSHQYMAGTLERMSSRLREARAHREQAVRILQKYSEEYPQWPEVKAQLASAQVMLAQFLMGLGEHELAHETCQSALHRWETLVFEFPDMLDYQVGLAGTQHNMSSILVAQGKAEEGLPMLTRARDRLQKTLERSGRHGKSDTLLLSVYDSLAETRRLLKQDLNDASKDEFQARRVKTAGEALRPSKFLTDLSSSAAQRRTVCASKRWFLV